MKSKILKLFFATLILGGIFLLGAITGENCAEVEYENILFIIIVALVSAGIGSICSKQSKPKTTKKDDSRDVYSHSNNK